MKSKLFQLHDIESGKLVKEVLVKYPTSWEDETFTLRNFINFMEITRAYHSFKKDLESLKGTETYDEEALKEAVFLADIVVALTGIDKDLIYTMDIGGLLEMQDDLAFVNQMPEKKMINKFKFRSITNEEEANIRKALKTAKRKRRHKEVSKIEKSLKEKLDVTWVIDEDAGQQSLRQWISSSTVSNEIKKINQEMQGGEFAKYPLLIAYCVKPKGKGFSINNAKKYANAFYDLPFLKAWYLTNFFFGLREILLQKTQTYLTLSTSLKMRDPKLLKKENT